MVDVVALIERGDKLFSERQTLMSLWQELADNFYTERADFTVTRTLGEDFCESLTTSYPLLVRRDLGNALGTMMRPKSVQWFDMTVSQDERLDHAGKEWLDYATKVQRRAMYDRQSQFTRACKEADHDNATFGQSVKTIETSRDRSRLLYRCWHLRDCAWAENAEGKVDTLHRKWKPYACELVALYGEAVSEKVKNCLHGPKKEPYKQIECRVITMPADGFNETYQGSKLDFVHIVIDVDNKHVMQVKGMPTFNGIIPRWQTVSGSQYSFSPATIIALPDARLIQAMMRTLLDASEMATKPAMIGVEEAIRSDVALYAGGITWVDEAYDERLGEVLRPVTADLRGMPVGFDMHDRVSAMLREAFFLNSLSLPVQAEDMTAFEVAQRVQEYIRQAAPIFEPLEDEDNAAMCEETFNILMRNGAFGRYEDIPQSVRGQEVEFRFQSPLHEAIERQKANTFMEAKQLLAQAADLDQTIVHEFNIRTAFRDTMEAVGVPAKWMVDPEVAEAAAEEEAMQAKVQNVIAQMQQGGEAAKAIGEANKTVGVSA